MEKWKNFSIVAIIFLAFALITITQIPVAEAKHVSVPNLRVDAYVNSQADIPFELGYARYFERTAVSATCDPELDFTLPPGGVVMFQPTSVSLPHNQNYVVTVTSDKAGVFDCSLYFKELSFGRMQIDDRYSANVKIAFHLEPKFSLTSSVIDNEIVPLLKGYSEKRFDHFYTTSQEKMNNAEATGVYSFQNNCCWILDSQVNYGRTSPVPLYEFQYSDNKHHLYSVSSKYPDSLGGYTNQGIVGYVFLSELPNTVPLYSFIERSTNSHFYTTIDEEFRYALASGYYRAQNPVYVFEKDLPIDFSRFESSEKPTLNLEPVEIDRNAEVTVLVNDSLANLDPTSLDSVTIEVRIQKIATAYTSIWSRVLPTIYDANLIETGPDTGLFEVDLASQYIPSNGLRFYVDYDYPSGTTFHSVSAYLLFPLEPEPEPVACTTIYAPVCSKDGETFSNLCVLKASDAEFDYGGKCVITQPEPTPDPGVCGNNILDIAEACDDGNNIDGDGCSATCNVESTPKPETKPVCLTGYTWDEANNRCILSQDVTDAQTATCYDGIDNDRDGHIDFNDADCLNPSQGESNPESNTQSDPTDSDFDGVPDSQDKCPTRPGSFKNNGCPILEEAEAVLVPKFDPRQIDNVLPLLLTPQDIVVKTQSRSGVSVDFSVKAIDNIDGILNPRCFPSSGSIFEIGVTTVNCSVNDSSRNSVSKIFLVTVELEEKLLSLDLPEWLPNVASFWCNDEIDDEGFSQVIEYLLDNEIIVIPDAKSGMGSSTVIPSWIKNNACWWSENQISDVDFASGLKFLIRTGVIQVQHPSISYK